MFYIVDVFSEKPFFGNPTAVVLEKKQKKFPAAVRAKIARELNLAVTVFVSESEKADYHFSFYTPKQEISLSGHACLAAAWLLASQKKLSPEKKELTIETKIGSFTCELHWQAETLEKIYLVLKNPSYKELTFDKNKLADVLGIRSDKIESNEKLPLVVADVGSPKLLVLISSKEMVDALVPKFDELERLCRRFKVSGLHLYTFDTYYEGSTCYTRQFEIIRGVPESPASALANGALAAFLVERGFAQPGVHVIEQGESLERENKIEVHVVASNGKVSSVKVGGKACVVFEFKPLLKLPTE